MPMLYLGKLLLKAVWVMILTFVGAAGVFAQTMHNQHPDTVFINSSQQLALKILAGTDTLSRSLYWPNIDPALFYDNVRMNVLYPDKINQGQSNNLCGYATVTYILLKYQPEVYVQSIIELYQKGELHLNKKKFRASKNVRNAAGTLKYNGDLQILHANQLWLLFLADNFKGYINILNYKYQRGDEKNLWASTTYAKFNRMLKRIDNYPTEALGSDLIRPWRNKFKYLSREIHSGTIILYVNSNYIRPSKYTLFKWPMPTHYIVLNEISRTDGVIQIKYWDYGLKTEQFVTKKGLRKMIYGITKIRS